METTKRKRKKFNNSKYRFHQLRVGDTFKVKPVDKHSMQNALNYFNKRYNAGIELYIDEISDEHEFTVTRIK